MVLTKKYKRKRKTKKYKKKGGMNGISDGPSQIPDSPPHIPDSPPPPYEMALSVEGLSNEIAKLRYFIEILFNAFRINPSSSNDSDLTKAILASGIPRINAIGKFGKFDNDQEEALQSVFAGDHKVLALDDANPNLLRSKINLVDNKHLNLRGEKLVELPESFQDYIDLTLYHNIDRLKNITTDPEILPNEGTLFGTHSSDIKDKLNKLVENYLDIKSELKK